MDARSAEEMLSRLTGDAALLAARFGLRYRSIEAERPQVKRRYGVCFSDGTIRIRLRHAVTGRPLRYSSLVNTLCHELAHLRHFDHSLRFRRLYLEILEYARARAIYRPGICEQATPGTRRPEAPLLAPHRRIEPPAAAGPRQLPLFG
jgi:predicted metal-dependent hydrolase